MKRIWILLPFLSGCLFGGGEKSRVTDTPEDLKTEKVTVPPTYDVHLFGPVAACRVGQWATYTIVKGGETQTLTLAAVGQDGDRLWIEVIEEGEVRHASARRVGPDGVIDQAWYRVIPVKGAPSRVYRQEIAQYVEKPHPPLEMRGKEAKDDEVKIGGKIMPARVVKVDFEDFNGRVVSEQTWWSKSLPPLYAASDEGGLVRKVAEGLTVEIVAFGDGAKPLIEIPK